MDQVAQAGSNSQAQDKSRRPCNAKASSFRLKDVTSSPASRSAPVHAGLHPPTPKCKRVDCGAEVGRVGRSPLAARLTRRLSSNVASACKDKISKSRRGASNTLLHIHKDANAVLFHNKKPKHSATLCQNLPAIRRRLLSVERDRSMLGCAPPSITLLEHLFLISVSFSLSRAPSALLWQWLSRRRASSLFFVTPAWVVECLSRTAYGPGLLKGQKC